MTRAGTPRTIRLGDEHRGSRRREVTRVLRLVVARCVRIGNENRRRPRGRELVDRPAGPREGEVGRGKRGAEVVCERQQPVAVPPHATAQQREVSLSGEMENERPIVRERIDDDLIDGSGALAPAVDQEQRSLERQLEPPPSVIAGDRSRAGGYGTPRHAVLRARSARDREGEEHATGERQGEPVGQAQVRIRFHDRRGDPAGCRGKHHRARHVAAAAEDDVRATPLEDRSTREGRLAGKHERPGEAHAEPSWKARDLEGVELVARVRDELRLSPSPRPGERHERAAAAQRLGYRERRQHVAAGSPGCDQAPRRVGLGHQHLRC